MHPPIMSPIKIDCSLSLHIAGQSRRTRPWPGRALAQSGFCRLQAMPWAELRGWRWRLLGRSRIDRALAPHPQPEKPAQDHRRGPLLMVLSGLMFTVMVVLVKVLRGELPAVDIIFWRSFFALPMAWPPFAWADIAWRFPLADCSCAAAVLASWRCWAFFT